MLVSTIFVSCTPATGSSASIGPTKEILTGNWNGTYTVSGYSMDYRLTFQDNTAIIRIANTTYTKGTYTINGNIVSITTTHMSSDGINYSSLQNNGSMILTYNAASNTLIYNYLTSSIVFTKE